MKSTPRTPPRSGLRLRDLKQRVPVRSCLMNVKLPTDLVEQIDRLATQLRTTKTEVFVVLLNEGLTRLASGARHGTRRPHPSR